MMRKKITNKEKFQFREDEKLPLLPMVGRNSVQSRLAKKADDKLAYSQSDAGTGLFKDQGGLVVDNNNPEDNGSSRHGIQEGGPAQTMNKYRGSPDPVLDQIVAKLKSGLQLGTNLPTNQDQVVNIIPSTLVAKQDTVPIRLGREVPSAGAQPRSSGGGCICLRPLKLVMCEICGETFRARVSLVCTLHPKAVYLQDVKECKGCKQSDKQAMKEFELPPGMGKGMKNMTDRKSRWIGSN